MDLIFEHQMIQSIAYLEGTASRTTNDVFIVQKGTLELIDYSCLKNKYFVLSEKSRFKNERMKLERFQGLKQLELQAYMLLKYLRQLHKMGICHGDIKPANIFFDSYRRGFVTTDSGSLIPVIDGTDKFYRTCFTEYFASKDYVKKIRAGQQLTSEELKMEDIYQYKVTIQHQYMESFVQHGQTSEVIEKIIKLCDKYQNDMQVLSAIVLTDASIALNLIQFLRQLDNVPRFTESFWEFFANCLDHTFATLQIPQAKRIEMLFYDDSNAEKYAMINYYYIMDDIQGIARYTERERDQTNTRGKLYSYLQAHDKPHLWFPIILSLMDSIHDMHLHYQQGNQVQYLEIEIMKEFYDKLKQYDSISDPLVKGRECEAMADCIVHLYSNFQFAIIGTQTNQHPAFQLFDMIAHNTLKMVVSDEEKSEKLLACIQDQVKYYKEDGIYI
ncbi:hypothetical protein FGO68_gene10337 [Halteria grandinella]|uniref:Protein kinase domain-containing protein n=1 Tax=Halteria grandinella TaxID=5974 RepID=A0A8J8T5T2_HALGN|nr:hypothetical protein FGO68_gene10337 [Halteria grandinella]